MCSRTTFSVSGTTAGKARTDGRGVRCRNASCWAGHSWSITRSLAEPDALSDAGDLKADVKDYATNMLSGEITIRVRYAETDRMGLLHHANYLVYFEQGRTELLRSMGLTYKDLEDQGYLLVVTAVEVRYRGPAYYDDVLTLRTMVSRTRMARIDHRYEVRRD